MVQLMKSSDSDRGKKTLASKEKGPVKLEIADGFSEEKLHRPLHKRSKTPSSLEQQWGGGVNTSSTATASQYNPLDEPSPLGLRLRKSPSLLDLIQMKLSQSSPADSEAGNLGAEAKKSAAAASSMAEKLKASNFPASLLRIGKWEYKSRYEGDLVAKCYFAKHKLVWEVLEGGLKSKIEIQWSDIMALNANCPEEGPSTLNIVLSRQPLFFRETNPQPRKHTLWQATADFTDGQASLYRQHFLQCPQGLLIKHFEKLIQCDIRLNFLSRQPETTLDSPLFDTRSGVIEQEESKSRSFDSSDKDSSFSGFEVSHNALSSYLNKERDLVTAAPESKLQEAPSSSLGSTGGLSGLKRSRDWDQIKVPGLHPSMSMSDLMNHIGNCLTEQIDPSSSGNPKSDEVPGILEDIAEYLLSDSQSTAASDEKSLMARVNSLCCLLQKDPPPGQNQNQNLVEKPDSGILNESREDSVAGGNDGSGRTQSLGMSRKDSFSDLLLQLPRITSLPKFLFDISEESENHSL